MDRFQGVPFPARALELIAEEWRRSYRVEDIRCDIEKVWLLRHAQQLVTRSDVAADELYEHAPAFTMLYREVMLRNIEEPIFDNI